LNDAKRTLSGYFKRFPIIAEDFFLMRNGIESNLPTSGQHARD
jgi:hypothetical protein